MVVKLESNFWHMQATQIQNERLCSTAWHMYHPFGCLPLLCPALRHFSSPDILPTYCLTTQLITAFTAFASLVLLCIPASQHLPSTFSYSSSCYHNQLGFLETKRLLLLLKHLQHVSIAYRIAYNFSSWVFTFWDKPKEL